MNARNSRRTVLFIGALPPPITGQSLACAVFLDRLRQQHEVIAVDINKSDLSSGGLVWGRVIEIARILSLVVRSARQADAVYFTITESLLGNLKDLLIYLACWRLLPRTVIHLHGGAGMIRLLHGPTGFLRRLNKIFLDRMSAIIVLGDRLRLVYRGVEERRLHVVPNFAETEYQICEEAIERKFEATGRLRILYLSNMIPEKGYLLLRDAVIAVANERPGALEVDYAGGFVTADDETDFLASIAPHPFIRYHGVVKGEEKKQLLQQSHLLALPTFYPYEGQPICILEGYAAGCAVLTTDHSGIFDVFTPGENGWAVQKRSSESIAAALLECLDQRDAIGQAARRNASLAATRFTPERYTGALMTIIDQALSQPID
jgi:glycosyltransferase involved in cell wall biosynthesis